MKILRDDAFYVQLADLIFFHQPQFNMPKSLNVDFSGVGNFKKAKYDFFQVHDAPSIEFLSGLQWIDDFDEINSIPDETEIFERLSALMREASHSRKYSEKRIVFTCILHQMSALDSYISFRRGTTTWQLPEEMELPLPKKRKLTIRELFEFI